MLRMTGCFQFYVVRVFGGERSGIHQPLHFAHGFIDAAEERATDDTVADVQLVQVRDRADFGDINVIDPMTRVDNEACGVS